MKRARGRPRPAAIDGEHPGLSLAGGEPQRFEIHFQPVGIDVFNMPDRQAGKTKRMVPGHQHATFCITADAIAFQGDPRRDGAGLAPFVAIAQDRQILAGGQGIVAAIDEGLGHARFPGRE